MGLHKLLCRPFLFYLVMDNENTDSQSAVKGKESVTTVFRNTRNVLSVKKIRDSRQQIMLKICNILIINVIILLKIE